MKIADILICLPALPASRPPPCASRVGVCSRCDREVWIAEGFCREQVEGGAAAVCVPCAAKGIKDGRLVLTKQQVKEIGDIQHRQQIERN